jgi:hypothetical protein
MTTFLGCILGNFLSPCDLLGRRTRGDYTPDTLPQSFRTYSRAWARPTRPACVASRWTGITKSGTLAG